MQEFLYALSQVRIDRSLVISSPLNGFIQYNLVIDRIIKRGSLFKLQDKAIIKYYVNGLSSIPEVRSQMEQLLLCDGLNLAVVKSSCEKALTEYVQHLSVNQLKLMSVSESDKSVSSGSMEEEIKVKSESEPISSTVAEVPKRICKACGGVWSHEHWQTCLKRNNASAPAKKSINALFSSSSSIQSSPLIVNGVSVPAYRDSMAEVSCISQAAINVINQATPEFSKLTGHESAQTLVMPDGTEHSNVNVVRLVGQSNVYGDSPVQLYYHVLPDEHRPFVLVGRDHGGLDRDSWMKYMDVSADTFCK